MCLVQTNMNRHIQTQVDGRIVIIIYCNTSILEDEINYEYIIADFACRRPTRRL